MQKIERVQQLDSGGVSTETTKVVRTDDEAVEPVQSPSVTAARVVWFIAGVIIALLAIRFVLIMLGANTGNGFVNLIYTISYPFAAPFFGIFGYTLHYGVSSFEISTLVAIIIYGLIGYGIARLLTIRRAA